MKKVFIFFAEGFEEIEAITPVDVLRRAGINVTTVSVTGKYEVEGSHQIKIVTDTLIEDIRNEQADMLILPGGMPGALNLNSNETLKEMLRKQSDSGKHVGAICAAPLVLGEMGLLENKTATCYPGFEDRLKGAEVTTNPVETAGNIVTGKGVGAAMKFALEIVAQLTDEETADDLAAKMVVE